MTILAFFLKFRKMALTKAQFLQCLIRILSSSRLTYTGLNADDDEIAHFGVR